MVLAGGVQEPRTEPEGDRAIQLACQRYSDVGERLVGDAVDIGHDREVTAGRQLTDQCPQRIRDSRRVTQELRTRAADLDRAVGVCRGRDRPGACTEEITGGCLGALDVGLVERVDPDQPARNGDGRLPEQHGAAE